MTRWRAWPAAGTVCRHEKKEAVQMTRLRRVFAALIVSVVVLMLVATLVLEGVS
jgi:uncharacterized integral membrane protein